MAKEFTSSKIAYYIGIFIVVASHIALLLKKMPCVGDEQLIHSIANLVAGALIIYGWVDNVIY